MTVQDKDTLKGYFNTGDVPTEDQFADLIDSIPTVGPSQEAGPISLDLTDGILTVKLAMFEEVTTDYLNADGAWKQPQLAELFDVTIPLEEGFPIIGDGDTLGYDANSEKWGPKPAGDFYIWSPDAIQQYQTDDLADEFLETGGPDLGVWTLLNPDDTATLETGDVGLRIVNDVAPAGMTAMVRDDHGVDITGVGKMFTKIRVTTGEKDCGLILCADGITNPETTEFVTFGWHMVPGISSVFSANHYTNYETWDSLLGTAFSPVYGPVAYLAVIFSLDYTNPEDPIPVATFDMSYDAISWIHVVSITMPFTPRQIGLYSRPILDDSSPAGITKTVDNTIFQFFRTYATYLYGPRIQGNDIAVKFKPE